MGEVTLKVPAEHLELFKAGMAHEIKDNAAWVEEHQTSIANSQVYADPRGELENGTRPSDPSEVRSSKQHLDEAVSILAQLLDAEDGQGVEARASAYEGASVMVCGLQAMLRYVVLPKAGEAVGYAPLAGGPLEALAKLGDTLQWAVQEVPRLEAHCMEAMAERKAAA